MEQTRRLGGGSARVSQNSPKSRGLSNDGDDEAAFWVRDESNKESLARELDMWKNKNRMLVDHCLRFKDRTMFIEYSSKRGNFLGGCEPCLQTSTDFLPCSLWLRAGVLLPVFFSRICMR